MNFSVGWHNLTEYRGVKCLMLCVKCYPGGRKIIILSHNIISYLELRIFHIGVRILCYWCSLKYELQREKEHNPSYASFEYLNWNLDSHVNLNLTMPPC